MPEPEQPQGGTSTNDNPQGGQNSQQPAAQATATPQPKTNPVQQERLSDEAARRRVENRELREQVERLVKLNEQMISTVEAERKACEAAEAAAKKAEQERTRLQIVSDVATANKLPPELAKRLQGNTKEEIEADAKLVVDALKAQGLSTQGAGSSRTQQVNTGTLGDATPASRANMLVDMVEKGRVTDNPFRMQES